MDAVTMKIKDDEGNLREAEILLEFQLKDDPKQYIIYTFNDVDEDGLLTISVSEIEFLENGEANFLSINDDKTWEEIKKMLRKIINSSKED